VNLSETWQTWLRVLTSPSEATFEAERQKPSATLTTALIWMVIAGVVTGVLGYIQSLVMAESMRGAIPQMLEVLDLPPESEAQLVQLSETGAFGNLGAASLGSIISVPLGFLIGVGILWLLARLLGGVGEYGRYAYLSATYTAPLTIVSALLGLVPFVGCLSFILYIYQIVLSYYATKVEHQLSSGRALIVVLIPIIFTLLLVFCLVFFFVGMLATLMQAGS
jgi:hypothetical protein